jgi:4-hydroxy-tetrahydrodipicolinate synthase
VVSNVAPRLCADLQEATLGGDYAKALQIQDRLMPLHASMFVEPNPSPVKYALARLGLMTDEVRLPLLTVSAETKSLVDAALRHAGLLDA